MTFVLNANAIVSERRKFARFLSSSNILMLTKKERDSLIWQSRSFDVESID
jgi:hypothetical protein